MCRIPYTTPGREIHASHSKIRGDAPGQGRLRPPPPSQWKVAGYPRQCRFKVGPDLRQYAGKNKDLYFCTDHLQSRCKYTLDRLVYYRLRVQYRNVASMGQDSTVPRCSIRRALPRITLNE